MFKPSKNSQGDLFKDISTHLCGRKQKLLESPHSWHNVFYKEVVSRIDESLFSELYHERMGRPNACIRILIGMMILKEGNGWSDEQLYTECRFNIMVMRSLGLYNMDDDVPAESTYYEFRRLLGEYYEDHQRDLMKEVFIKITTDQVAIHGVSGKKIRLDSKLINSNIAKSNRLHLIVEAVRKYVSGKPLNEMRTHMDASSYEILEALQTKSTSNLTYPLNAHQKKEMLVSMGQIIGVLLEHGKGSVEESYVLLKRIYEEQYEQKDNDENDDSPGGSDQKVVLKQPKDIPSSSVQSIHDPDAAYRTKGQGGKQTVTGYHSNVTESCDPQEDVHLILDVEVVKANVSEDAFLIKTVDTCQQILEQAHDEGQKIEEVITDGGYDSIANREEMLKEQRPQWSIAKMKGRSLSYQMEKDEQGNLEVFDRQSGHLYSERAQKCYPYSRWKQKIYDRRTNRQLHTTPTNTRASQSGKLQSKSNSRINHPSMLSQTRNKIIYRGLVKCHWYVLSSIMGKCCKNYGKNREKYPNILSLATTMHHEYSHCKSQV